MNYQYKKENGGLKVYLMDNGHKVSDFEFNKKECNELYANLCEVLFDDLLEKNKDVLYRLKNNIPPPKMVSLDEVCSWLRMQFYNDDADELIEDLKKVMED